MELRRERAEKRAAGPPASVVRLLVCTLLVLAAGCTASQRPARRPIENGIASWYGPGFAGRATASGEIFDPRQLTAAHKSLPFGTFVRVVNLDNGRSVIVRINDRGPFVRRRIIDLSRAAAEEIGMIGPGTARVQLYMVTAAGTAATATTYRVQVGAFRARHRAEGLARELRATGRRVVIAEESGWYRVRVGRFERREEAERERRRLDRDGYPARVVDDSD